MSCLEEDPRCVGSECHISGIIGTASTVYFGCCPVDAECAVPTSCRSQEDMGSDVFEGSSDVLIWYVKDVLLLHRRLTQGEALGFLLSAKLSFTQKLLLSRTHAVSRMQQLRSMIP